MSSLRDTDPEEYLRRKAEEDEPWATRDVTLWGSNSLSVTGSPITIHCPACNARPGEPCTTPTATSRRSVAWFHNIRTDRAAER